jgi:hypothetical protein
MNFYLVIGILFQKSFNCEELFLKLLNTNSSVNHDVNNNRSSFLNRSNDIILTNEYVKEDDFKWYKNLFHLDASTASNKKKYPGYSNEIQNTYYNPFKNHDDFSFTNIKNKFLRFSATSIILILLILIFCMLTYKLKMHFATAQRNRYAFTLASINNFNSSSNTSQFTNVLDNRPYPNCYHPHHNQVPLMTNNDTNDLPPSYASLNFDQNNNQITVK